MLTYILDVSDYDSYESTGRHRCACGKHARPGFEECDACLHYGPPSDTDAREAAIQAQAAYEWEQERLGAAQLARDDAAYHRSHGWEESAANLDASAAKLELEVAASRAARRAAPMAPATATHYAELHEAIVRLRRKCGGWTEEQIQEEVRKAEEYRRIARGEVA